MRETYPISSCERKRAFDVDIQRLDRALAGVVGSCSKYFQVCFFNGREGGRELFEEQNEVELLDLTCSLEKLGDCFVLITECARNASKAKGYFATRLRADLAWLRALN